MNLLDFESFITIVNSNIVKFIHQQLFKKHFIKTSFNKFKTEVINVGITKDGPKSGKIHKIKSFSIKNTNSIESAEEIIKKHILSIESISVYFNKVDDYTKELLERLIEHLAYVNLENLNIDIRNLSKIIKKNFDNQKKVTIAKYFISGISISSGEIELDFKKYILRVRKPNNDDIVEMHDLYHLGFFAHKATLEVEFMDTSSYINYANIFENIKTPFELYGITDLIYSGLKSKSFFYTSRGNHAEGFKGNIKSFHILELDNSNDQNELLTKIYLKIIETNILNTNESDTKKYPIFISIERYKAALRIDPNKIDRKITEIIMGLESLYLQDEKETLGYKLKYRIAQVFNFFDLDHDLTLKILALSYAIRSAFAHGSPKSGSTKKELAKFPKDFDITYYLLNLLRQSILVFLFLTINKIELIALIDKSFVDENSRNDLKKLIIKSKMEFTNN